MDTNTALDFIEKAIKKTKSGALVWTVPSSSHNLKLLPDTKYPFAFGVSSKDYLPEHSYVASFETGEIQLLVFSKQIENIFITPPDGCTLSLRMQDNKSKYAVEITSTQYDPADCVALIRLYNLIDKNSSSIKTLISNFLNS